MYMVLKGIQHLMDGTPCMYVLVICYTLQETTRDSMYLRNICGQDKCIPDVIQDNLYHLYTSMLN